MPEHWRGVGGAVCGRKWGHSGSEDQISIIAADSQGTSGLTKRRWKGAQGCADSLPSLKQISFLRKFIYGARGIRSGYCCAFKGQLSAPCMLTERGARASCTRCDSVYVTEERKHMYSVDLVSVHRYLASVGSQVAAPLLCPGHTLRPSATATTDHSLARHAVPVLRRLFSWI
ncbi:hypothetical protein NDU88_001523 [Pleurodeles waltl]|uniref:Uncharacterized protein n=1 Tax=Pleurodeles waltl TaxID=8319 RepID=A0AAV7TIY7_PLEWA|nr:hypothetical protein NDU88_001523 [Pleurodeles waltl]